MRERRHAIVIWLDENGWPTWDHSDQRAELSLNAAQRDTAKMIHAGYKSAQRSCKMVEDARQASNPKLPAEPLSSEWLTKHTRWQQDADETERLLHEEVAG